MVKKWIKRVGLAAGCILAYALPAYAAGESVSLEAKGNEAVVSLELPAEGVSDNETANYDRIHSLQLGMKITSGSREHISFVFDEGITSDVKEYRYQQETGSLNVYISGQQNLFENKKLVIGKVVLDSKAGNNAAASVQVVEDSLKTVNAAYNMQNMKVRMPEAVQLEVKTSTPPAVTKKVQNPTVKPAKLTFKLGGKAQTLKVTGAKGSLKYSIDKPKVASVNSKGRVTPKAAGKALIKIVASGNSTYRARTMRVWVTVKPNAPSRVTNVKVAAGQKKGRMKVTWKKTSATGYQIRYSRQSTMKKTTVVNVPRASAKAKTVKKVPSNRRVYVQVRAYRTKNGATSYGKWSKKAVSDKIIK